VEDFSPGLDGFVGGEEHGALMEVPCIDNLVKEVGGLRGVGDVADFINDESRGMGVVGEDFTEAALVAGPAEMVEEVGEGDESGFAAVLDGAVGDGHGQVGFARAGRAGEDEVAAFEEEFGAEVRAKELPAEGGLEREIEFLDGP
jgi:hypothetical protein